MNETIRGAETHPFPTTLGGPIPFPPLRVSDRHEGLPLVLGGRLGPSPLALTK